MRKVTSPVLFAFLILCLCGCGGKDGGVSARAKAKAPVQKMADVRGYTDCSIGDFTCGLYVPPTYTKDRKYPLIVYLHGYSDTKSNPLVWYAPPISDRDPCIVLTPKCPVTELGRWGDSYTAGTSPMMEKTYVMMELTAKNFSLDPDRYYIYGVSMGGYGVYGVLQKNPGTFAAAYVECGAGDAAIAPALAKMPLWIFHGSADPVVSVQPDRDLYKAILDSGGKTVRYTEYPGVEHNTWDYVAQETTLPQWLLAQRRGSVHSAPANVPGFQAERMPDCKISLSWAIPDEKSLAADDRIWYVRLYRDGQSIAEVYNNQDSYSDSVSSGAHSYSIRAVSYYFLESKPSPAILVPAKP